MKKEVLLLTGAGQIGMARRMGYGKKIVIGDKKPENARATGKIMEDGVPVSIPFHRELS